jgi:hypothetical protein
MAGQQVRGRYPLTALWLLAEWRGDEDMLLKVTVWCALVQLGKSTKPEVFELYLQRYADGVH